MPYTEFHYTPTGTGVISGKEVLEQTEDAINDLGGQISGDVQTAIDTANNALNTANTASADAQNAVNTANTAYTAATNAQNTANTAQNTASNALTAAQNAQNDVNALGNRVTTAENNISQNTSDISGLTTRMGTAEGNITTLQNDVITAQGTATSAQNTATLARGQAYVVRYASVAVSDNSTVPYTDLNNTDNIKANDLLLDTNGKLYQITSVDTSNETVSVTTPLTQLAVDSDVVHKRGDETSTGFKQFANIRATNSIKAINLENTTTDLNNCYSNFAPYGENKGGNIQYYYCNTDAGTANISNLPEAKAFFLTSITPRLISNSLYVKQILINSSSKTFVRYCANGTWSSWVNETDSEYVHKSGNETINGNKTFSSINGVEPSSLGMPATTGAIDISSYVTDLTGVSVNTYTPLANGYIVITCNANNVDYIKMSNNFDFVSVVDNTNNQFTSGILGVWQPCVAGISVQIRIKSSALRTARFIPCQGNV